MAGNMNGCAIFAGSLHPFRLVNLNLSMPCDGTKRRRPTSAFL